MSIDDKRKEIEARYANGKLTVTVGSCKECVFFRTTLLTIFTGGKGGECYAPVAKLGGGVVLNQGLPVDRTDEIPKGCPLRLGNVVITIGNRGST